MRAASRVSTLSPRGSRLACCELSRAACRVRGRSHEARSAREPLTRLAPSATRHPLPQRETGKQESKFGDTHVITVPLRVGVGGPVGSGKTALMDALCKRLRDRYEIAAITNDIYTKWDAEYLVRSGALVPDRIAGVETGGCPHTAIREDASANLAAIADMRQKFPGARSGADRIRRRQSRRDVFAGAGRSHHLRHRRRRRRQDSLEGRAGHHPLRSAGDQQDRSRALCRRFAGNHGARE